MLDDGDSLYEGRSTVRKRRRKRVQKRSTSRRDFQNWEERQVSHHSMNRLRKYRRRRFARFFQIVFCLCLGLAIPYIAKWGYDTYVHQQDGYRLRNLQIETSGTLPASVVAEVAGIEQGTGLYQVDLKKAEQRILAIPAVESVSVARQKPDSLIITIKERIPAAWLACPDHDIKPLRDGGLLIDRSGTVWTCREMSDDLVVLPTVEVKGIPKPVAGTRVNSLQVAESLRLVEASQLLFSGKGMEIIDIRALGTWGLLCRYPDDLLVTFDLNRIDEGLSDLKVILEKSAKSNLSLATVNLVTVKNIPVTFHSRSVPDNW